MSMSSSSTFGSKTVSGSQRVRRVQERQQPEPPERWAEERLSVRSAAGAASSADDNGDSESDVGSLPNFLSAADVAMFKSAFEQFDKDKSGSIDTKERPWSASSLFSRLVNIF